MRFILVTILFAFPLVAQDDFKTPKNWRTAKNDLDDKVYQLNRHTFYCGCDYTSDGDSDGSGDIKASECGINLPKKQNVKDTIQWEHIVPASLMPVGKWQCWQKESEIPACSNKRNRDCCAAVSPSSKLMIFDRHNIAPSAAQINQYRTNDRYGLVSEVDGAVRMANACPSFDIGGTNVGGLFEPQDCKKGDVARVWFYMETAHGVEIPDTERDMFKAWSESDPVSPWESERDKLIAGIQGNHNPYVAGVDPDPSGACHWEPGALAEDQ